MNKPLTQKNNRASLRQGLWPHQLWELPENNPSESRLSWRSNHASAMLRLSVPGGVCPGDSLCNVSNANNGTKSPRLTALGMQLGMLRSPRPSGVGIWVGPHAAAPRRGARDALSIHHPGGLITRAAHGSWPLQLSLWRRGCMLSWINLVYSPVVVRVHSARGFAQHSRQMFATHLAKYSTARRMGWMQEEKLPPAKWSLGQHYSTDVAENNPSRVCPTWRATRTCLWAPLLGERRSGVEKCCFIPCSYAMGTSKSGTITTSLPVSTWSRQITLIWETPCKPIRICYV